jgi:hypothetical protein
MPVASPSGAGADPAQLHAASGRADRPWAERVACLAGADADRVPLAAESRGPQATAATKLTARGCASGGTT